MFTYQCIEKKNKFGMTKWISEQITECFLKLDIHYFQSKLYMLCIKLFYAELSELGGVVSGRGWLVRWPPTRPRFRPE